MKSIKAGRWSKFALEIAKEREHKGKPEIR